MKRINKEEKPRLVIVLRESFELLKGERPTRGSKKYVANKICVARRKGRGEKLDLCLCCVLGMCC